MANDINHFDDPRLSYELINERKQNGKLIAHLCIVMFIVTVVFIGLNHFYSFNMPWYIFAALGSASGLVFWLNKNERQSEARIFGLLALNLIVYAVASSETHLTNVNLYFATAGTAALVLFGYKERLKSLLFIVLSFLLYLSVRFIDYSPLPYRNFSSNEITIISFANLVVFAYVTTYSIILLLRSNYIRKENLFSQNNELIKINDELDRFIYSSSHDLRAPLSSLLGLIQLSELEKDEPLKREYLRMMRDRIASMDRFIKEIMDYAKNARQEVTCEKIKIKDELHSIIDDLKYMEGANSISITCSGIDNVEITSDLMRLHIVLSNLISNAIKYRDVSKPQPELHINGAIDQSSFKLEFTDNGVGIAPAHREKVFGMFYRAHDFSNGSGLGLYLVRETLNTLKGSIKIISEVGVGSSFTITLPTNN